MKGRNDSLFRKDYIQNAILLFYLGCIWLISGIVGFYESHIGILLFLTGSSLVKPLFHSFKRTFGIKERSEEANLLISILTIGTPLSLTIVFFPFVENINIFFPAFSLFLGTIFTMTAQAVNFKPYWFLGLTLILSSVYTWLNHLTSFTAGAYITSGILLLSALITRLVPEVKKSSYIKRSTSDISREQTL